MHDGSVDNGNKLLTMNPVVRLQKSHTSFPESIRKWSTHDRDRAFECALYITASPCLWLMMTWDGYRLFFDRINEIRTNYYDNCICIIRRFCNVFVIALFLWHQSASTYDILYIRIYINSKDVYLERLLRTMKRSICKTRNN